MQLIVKNEQIYLEFQGRTKRIQKPLKLQATKENLAYATTTLLPIFTKISSSAKLHSSIQAPSHSSKPHKSNQKPRKPTAQTPTLNDYLCLHIQTLAINAKQTTLRSANYAKKTIFRYLDNKPLAHYTPYDIEFSIAKMRQNLSPKSILTTLSYASSAFKLAQKQGIITQNPINLAHKPKANSKQTPVLHPKDIQTLLTHAKGELKTFLYIAFFTGARSGEILALSSSDIDFKTHTIHITKNQTRFELTSPKNGKPRKVYLLNPLKRHLQSLNLNAKNLFHKDYFQIYYEFKKLLKALNLPPIGLHSTRHSFASFLLKNHIDSPLIAKLLGHSSTTLLERTYAHFIKDKTDIALLTKALAKIAPQPPSY